MNERKPYVPKERNLCINGIWRHQVWIGSDKENNKVLVDNEVWVNVVKSREDFDKYVELDMLLNKKCRFLFRELYSFY